MFDPPSRTSVSDAVRIDRYGGADGQHIAGCTAAESGLAHKIAYRSFNDAAQSANCPGHSVKDRDEVTVVVGDGVDADVGVAVRTITKVPELPPRQLARNIAITTTKQPATTNRRPIMTLAN